jgi:hypothetical protein
MKSKSSKPKEVDFESAISSYSTNFEYRYVNMAYVVEHLYLEDGESAPSNEWIRGWASPSAFLSTMVKWKIEMPVVETDPRP